MKKLTGLAILLLLVSSVAHVLKLSPFTLSSRSVYASVNEDNERDEEDHEDREDDNREESAPTPTPSSSKSGGDTKTETIIVPATTTTTNTWVYDPGYNIDTDGDGLVDAIDPDPNVKQTLFFTDSDSDGVADAFDVYPGEDDFTYTNDTDVNGNGIVDSMENL